VTTQRSLRAAPLPQRLSRREILALAVGLPISLAGCAGGSDAPPPSGRNTRWGLNKENGASKRG